MATTVKDSVVSVRLNPELIGQLDELASEMHRSRSFLIAQAVHEFVEREIASLEALRQGESDMEAGRSLTGDDARDWFANLKAGIDSPARHIPDARAGGKRRNR